MAKPKKIRPIVEETLQEPPAVKRELSKSRLDADLSERLRRPVKGYCSQGHTDYEYGYSWVRIPGLGDEGVWVVIVERTCRDTVIDLARRSGYEVQE